MDVGFLVDAVPYAGAAAGALGHMVKKKAEAKKAEGEGEVDEVQILKNMILKRPTNTLAMIATALVGVTQLVVPESSTMQQFITAFAIAWASDSAVNRSGK